MAAPVREMRQESSRVEFRGEFRVSCRTGCPDGIHFVNAPHTASPETTGIAENAGCKGLG